jgi:hypothetical protein
MVKKTILNHNAPLLPTQRQLGQLNSSNFARFFLASFSGIRSTPRKPVFGRQRFGAAVGQSSASQVYIWGDRAPINRSTLPDGEPNNRFFRGNLLKIGRNPLVFGLFYAILAVPMAIQKKNAFSRRLPDLVTEELVTVLSQKKSFEFKQLFAIVHENLRQRNAASGGEEMLRLRAYEKLQNLVARGVVKKTGKSYKGDSGALAAMAAANAAQAAAIASKS